MAKLSILIIGGGVIAWSLAWQLAQKKAAVTVVSDEGSSASLAAAGMLAPSFEARHPRAGKGLGRILHNSLELWDDFAHRLSYDPLQDLDYCREGIIAVDYPPDIFPTSVPHPPLSAIMSKRMVLLPGEGQVNPRQLLPLLKKSAQSFGAVLVNRRALAFWEEGRHVIGCFLENEDPIRADYVILAAGAGGDVFFPSKKPNLIPVRGRAFLVEAPHPLLPKVIRTQDIYLCPKQDGTLYVGATEEFMGQMNEKNLLDRLWEGAIKLYPALRDQKILQIFDGVRPAHVTGVPHVRWHGEKKNLILAQGHDRNGILLSPWTVKEVMGLLDL